MHGAMLRRRALRGAQSWHSHAIERISVHSFQGDHLKKFLLRFSPLEEVPPGFHTSWEVAACPAQLCGIRVLGVTQDIEARLWVHRWPFVQRNGAKILSSEEHIRKWPVPVPSDNVRQAIKNHLAFDCC